MRNIQQRQSSNEQHLKKKDKTALFKGVYVLSNS